MLLKAFSELLSPSFTPTFHVFVALSFFPCISSHPMFLPALPAVCYHSFPLHPGTTVVGEFICSRSGVRSKKRSSQCSQVRPLQSGLLSSAVDLTWACPRLVTGEPGLAWRVLPANQAKEGKISLPGGAPQRQRPWHTGCVKEFVQTPNFEAVQECSCSSKQWWSWFIVRRDRRIMNLSFQQMTWKIGGWSRLGNLIFWCGKQRIFFRLFEPEKQNKTKKESVCVRVCVCVM